MVSQLEPQTEAVFARQDGESPLRAIGRMLRWMSGVVNDPEVQEAGDALFGAMQRASHRELELVKSDGLIGLNASVSIEIKEGT